MAISEFLTQLWDRFGNMGMQKIARVEPEELGQGCLLLAGKIYGGDGKRSEKWGQLGKIRPLGHSGEQQLVSASYVLGL